MAVEAEVAGRDGGIGASLGQRLSGVLAFEPGQPLVIFGRSGRRCASRAWRARLRRGVPPPFGCRPRGGLDGTIHLGAAAARHGSQGSSGGRVDVVVQVGGGHRCAVDE